MQPLYVIAPIINPSRYKSRYALYRNFEKYVQDSGGILYTIEAAFGERPHEVSQDSNPRHIQLRTSTEIWLKENLVNIAISRLPADATYIAWVDADVTFARPDWVSETVHQLQHFDVVQMFSTAHDLGPNHETFQTHQGFGYSYVQKLNGPDGSYVENKFWHPGYAWAARKSALNTTGGLIDTAILGAGDHAMATALIGQVDKSIHAGVSAGYRQSMTDWQDRAAGLRKNIGYVDGTLLHYWHGKKKDRRYQERWQILVDTQYDPRIDLTKDTQGLYQLTNRSIELRDRCRQYFRLRNEDSIDL